MVASLQARILEVAKGGWKVAVCSTVYRWPGGWRWPGRGSGGAGQSRGSGRLDGAENGKKASMVKEGIAATILIQHCHFKQLTKQIN